MHWTTHCEVRGYLACLTLGVPNCRRQSVGLLEGPLGIGWLLCWLDCRRRSVGLLESPLLRWSAGQSVEQAVGWSVDGQKHGTVPAAIHWTTQCLTLGVPNCWRRSVGLLEGPLRINWLLCWSAGQSVEQAVGWCVDGQKHGNVPGGEAPSGRRGRQVRACGT